jgi:hypothetical protein
MTSDEALTQSRAEVRALQAEVNYYRSLLFTRIDPLNSSVLNALRHAVDICEENRKLKEDPGYARLQSICIELESENRLLKDELARLMDKH